MFHYETMLALFNEAWSASVDDFTPRKKVINESNHWKQRRGWMFLFQLEEGCGHRTIDAQ